MEALTEREVTHLDTINMHTIQMAFGHKIQDLITALNATTSVGTPVNAVNAALSLAVTGVVLDGETVAINNPLVAGTDVYEFLADIGLSKTYQSNIAVDITVYVTKATGTLTVATKPTSGDTMTIGTKVYTFVPPGTATADAEISIGEDVTEARVNIVAAINGTDGTSQPHALVIAEDFASSNCLVAAIVGGTAGNNIATTETFTAVDNVFVGVTLESGANCTAANAIVALAAAVVASDTQGVTAIDGVGDTVSFTADTAGVAGNGILVTESLSNGAFAGAAVHFTGGVDGTVGVIDGTMIDASYLYKCVADNTVSGKNWRRISLGSAY